VFKNAKNIIWLDFVNLYTRTSQFSILNPVCCRSFIPASTGTECGTIAFHATPPVYVPTTSQRGCGCWNCGISGNTDRETKSSRSRSRSRSRARQSATLPPPTTRSTWGISLRYHRPYYCYCYHPNVVGCPAAGSRIAWLLL
jgi:hypothetical protein